MQATDNSTHTETDKKHRLVPTGQPGFTIPRLQMPADLKPDSREWCGIFTIETPKGYVRVRAYRKFECFGTAEALEAAGLLHPSWLPGLPGNNKSKQTILFTREGPCFVLGRPTAPFHENNEEVKNRFITICKTGKKFAVEIRPTEAQKERLNAFIDKLDRKRNEAREKEKNREYDREYEEARRKTNSDPENLERYIQVCIKSVSDYFDARLYDYTPESTARISQAIAELRQAFDEAELLEAPKYERIGDNVLGINFRKGCTRESDH